MMLISELEARREEAIEYIGWALRSGHTLSTFLGEKVELHAGSVFAYLPGGVVPAEFGWGIGASVAEGRSELLNVLETYLRRPKPHTVLLEHHLLDAGDNHDHLPDPVFEMGDGIVQAVNTSDEDRLIDEKVDLWSTVPIANAFIIPMSSQQIQAGLSESGSKTLERIAASTLAILSVAFDEEGFLLWTRGQALQQRP